MTDVKLVTSLPQGSGFTSRLAAEIYAEMVAEKPTRQIVVVGILEPVGYGQKRTANGTKNHVQFEAIKLEPVFDGQGADMVRHLLQEAFDNRHTAVQTLPLDFASRNDDDQRRFLLDALDEWATEEEVDLTESWWSYFDREFVAAPDKAGTVQLREFALAKGAIAEQEGDALTADGAGNHEDDELDEDAVDEPTTAQVVEFSSK